MTLYLPHLYISVLRTIAILVDDTANILCCLALYNTHHSVYNVSHKITQSTLLVSWWGASHWRWWLILCPIVPVKLAHDVISIEQAQLSQSQMYTQAQCMWRQNYVQVQSYEEVDFYLHKWHSVVLQHYDIQYFCKVTLWVWGPEIINTLWYLKRFLFYCRMQMHLANFFFQS